MAQALVVVCDVCGNPAVQTVTIKAGARSYQKDVCRKHLDELIHGARAPRRGRPRTKATPVATRNPTRRKAAAKSAAKRRTKTTARRKAAAS
jgi:hypothetical protein